MSAARRTGSRRLFALSAFLSIVALGGAMAPVALAGDPLGAVLGRPGLARATVPKRPHYPVLVVAHRGAPVYLPEHTLAGYRLAIEQGADYIEPDLVSTRDGYLIARHENDLTVTTDVRDHPELGGRTRAEELTLAEVKTLRAGGYEIPTLNEIITLVRSQRRQVGLYLELKAPAYFRQVGLPMEETLAATLAAEGWTGTGAPVFVSSFETDSLRRLRDLLPEVRRSRNVAPVEVLDLAVLDEIAGYASVLSLHRDRLRPGSGSAAADVLFAARERGLAVHVWTFGADCPYEGLAASLEHPQDPPGWRNAVRMYRAYYEMGVQAVFSDAPDIAVWARG